MAKSLAEAGNQVDIWALEQDVVDEINTKHTNRFRCSRLTVSIAAAGSSESLGDEFKKSHLLIVWGNNPTFDLHRTSAIQRSGVALVLCDGAGQMETIKRIRLRKRMKLTICMRYSQVP